MDVTLTKDKLAYTLPELARASGLSVQSIRNAINANELVPSYYRSKRLIPADEAKRWIDSLPTEPPADAA